MEIVKVTMIDRILADNESALKANKVSTEFGLKPAKNKAHLKENLRFLILDKNVSEQALLKLAKVHPDRELILEAENSNNNKNNKGKAMNNFSDDTLNCAGCGGTCGKLGAEGDGGVASYMLTEDHEVKFRGGSSQKFPKGSIVKGVIEGGKLMAGPDAYIPESKLKLASAPTTENKFKAFIDNYGKVMLIASAVVISGILVFRATRK